MTSFVFTAHWWEQTLHLHIILTKHLHVSTLACWLEQLAHSSQLWLNTVTQSFTCKAPDSSCCYNVTKLKREGPKSFQCSDWINILSQPNLRSSFFQWHKACLYTSACKHFILLIYIKIVILTSNCWRGVYLAKAAVSEFTRRNTCEEKTYEWQCVTWLSMEQQQVTIGWQFIRDLYVTNSCCSHRSYLFDRLAHILCSLDPVSVQVDVHHLTGSVSSLSCCPQT